MRTTTNRRPHKSRIRHDARTLPLRGTGDDEGKYYRCWNCGFICNVDRDSLGDGESRDGASTEFYYDYYPQSEGAYRGVASGLFLEDEGAAGDHTSPALALRCVNRGTTRTIAVGPDGLPVTTKLTYAPTVVSGCPGCGTKNWRGDYR